jgi:predicted SprT family Zn-dependent metalloprotease
MMKKLNTLARFEYQNNKKGKAPIKRQIILFSEYYDFDEETFKNLMVHEMIHYYLAWNGVKTELDHGKEFMAIANELNEKYGLNVTKTLDASSFIRREQAPKAKGFWLWLLG